MPEEHSTIFQTARNLFQQRYGDGDIRVWRAPARINILGEHVDYVSYLPTASLPFASHEHAMTMLFRANDRGSVRGASLDQRFASFEFAVPDRREFSASNWQEYLYQQLPPAPDWSNYVKGAVYFAAQQFGGATGFDFVIASSIPPQGGSSSSSALVVLAGAAFRAVNAIAYSARELAQDSAQAEWFIGTRGGSLDHTTICLAKPHHAIHLRYADQQTELIPLPAEGFRWVTFFTHAADKGREIMLEYNERVAVARLLIPAMIERWKTNDPNLYSTWRDEVDLWEAGVRPINGIQTILQQFLPETISLSDVREQDPTAFHQCEKEFPALVQERLTAPLKLRNRALHHIGEIRRVAFAVQLLRQEKNPDVTMRALGALLDATHVSLRDLYDVCTPDVNDLWEILHSHSKVFGARLIGGGFGGNVLVLTTTDHVEALITRVQVQYYGPRHRDGRAEGAVMVSTPGAGCEETMD
jgi:galactokinase